MLIAKEKVKVSDGVVHMKLPEKYRDKTVEVIIRIESEIEKKLLSDKSIKVFIDTNVLIYAYSETEPERY